MIKKVSIFIGIIIVIISILGYFTSIKITSPLNNDILVYMKNISINSIEGDFIDQLIKYESFYNCKMTTDEINNISINHDKYKLITIDYDVENNSDEIEIKDIRIFPDFSNDLNQYIYKYNSGNGTYFIHAEPKSLRGLRQYIIIESKGKTEDELHKLYLSSQAKMTYYSNNSGKSNGQELVGYGKHEIVFNLSDGEIVSCK